MLLCALVDFHTNCFYGSFSNRKDARATTETKKGKFGKFA